MANDSQDRRKLLIEYIAANSGDNILEQFFKITKLITDYNMLNSKDSNNESIEKSEFDSRLNFVNEVYNCMNVINKIIALSVDRRKKPSVAVHNMGDESDAAIAKNKPTKATATSGYIDTTGDINKSNFPATITTTAVYPENKSSTNKKKKSNSTKTSTISKKEKLIKELDALGVPKGTFTRKVMEAIGDIKDVKGMTPQDVINEAASIVGSKPNLASAVIATAMNKIDVSNAIYAKTLKYYKGHYLSKEDFVDVICNEILID